MSFCLTSDAIIDAECIGNGRLQWAWVLICTDSAALLARSEPMFRTRKAALRVGAQLVRFKQRKTDLATA